MRYFSTGRPLFYNLAFAALIGWQLPLVNLNSVIGGEVKGNLLPQNKANCQGKKSLSSQLKQNFIAVGGGPVPDANEIAIEKNVLYFQRTLTAMGYNPAQVPTFFADGNNGQATVSYLDAKGRQRFKVPEIPNLKGASTMPNLLNAFQQLENTRPDSVFFYFTGHGIPDPDNNTDNNALLLWNEELVSVQEFASLLDRLPSETSFVTMMSQCYSGSFANLIYEGGDPKRPVALKTRCGFFATVKTRPSVGCSPEVNEADYRDYSSSFFAGLSGRSRTGQVVASADYNKDGRVSYLEAHAFAKIDEKNTDWPLSTSEAWLQRKADIKTQETILQQPIAAILQTARPEQSYVVNSFVKLFQLNLEKSFRANQKEALRGKVKTEEQEAYVMRLKMELINIGMEKRLRDSQNIQDIAILDRLVKCENGSWGKP